MLTAIDSVQGRPSQPPVGTDQLNPLGLDLLLFFMIVPMVMVWPVGVGSVCSNALLAGVAAPNNRAANIAVARGNLFILEVCGVTSSSTCYGPA